MQETAENHAVKIAPYSRSVPLSIGGLGAGRLPETGWGFRDPRFSVGEYRLGGGRKTTLPSEG
jgi:hypothetical protein